MKPLISVVLLASESRKDFLLSSISAVLAQKYANIELILCDGCSSDFDEKEIADYIEEHKRENLRNTIVYRQERYDGEQQQYFDGLRLASGEFIKFISPDCALHSEESLEVLMNIIPSSGADILFTRTYNKTCNRFEPSHEGYIEVQHVDNPYGMLYMLATFPFTYILSPDAALFKTASLRECGAFTSEYATLPVFMTLFNMLKQDKRFQFLDFVSVDRYLISGRHYQPEIMWYEDLMHSNEYVDALKTHLQPYVAQNYPVTSRLKCKQLIKKVQLAGQIESVWLNASAGDKIKLHLRNALLSVIDVLYLSPPAPLPLQIKINTGLLKVSFIIMVIFAALKYFDFPTANVLVHMEALYSVVFLIFAAIFLFLVLKWLFTHLYFLFRKLLNRRGRHEQ